MKKEGMGHATLTCKLISSSSVKLISATDGTITKFHRPVRAAELMTQNPGWFVCDSADLNVGLRVPGLTADEKLQPSRLYFLLPVDMLYSVLTDEEMDSLSCKASLAFKKGGWKNGIGRKEKKTKSVRKIERGSDFCFFQRSSGSSSNGECIEEFVSDSDAETLETVRRDRDRDRAVAWRPGLDTILEVC